MSVAEANRLPDSERITRRVWFLTLLGVATIGITLGTVWMLHSRSRAARLQAAEIDAKTGEAMSLFSRELTTGRAALDEILDQQAKEVGDGVWISRLADGFSRYSREVGRTRVADEMVDALPT
jgi:hypothetical protein